MTIDANSSVRVTQIRDRLQGCTTWATTLGLTVADMYYPDPTTVTAPACVIQPGASGSTKLMDGTLALPRGTFDLLIYFDFTTVSIAQAEAYAELIGNEMVSQETGLYVTDYEFDVSSEPEDGDEEQLIAIRITCNYGLEG